MFAARLAARCAAAGVRARAFSAAAAGQIQQHKTRAWTDRADGRSCVAHLLSFYVSLSVRCVPRQAASRATLGLSALSVGAAVVAWNVSQQLDSTTAECAPAAAASPSSTSPPVQPAIMLPVGCYDRTSSRLDGLTPEALANTSLADLAKRYDPSKPDKSSLLHGIMWGGQTAHRHATAQRESAHRENLRICSPRAHSPLCLSSPLAAAPPPPNGLAALPLMFTASDPDPFHRHMELLVRTIQDRICTDLIDVERFAADRALGSAGAPATLKEVDGSPINSKLRELLLVQSDKAATFPERIALRPGIGGGIERVMSGGRVFSKAGINVTVANVDAPREAFLKLLPDHPSLAGIEPPEKFKLFTASVSLVLHAVSPHVPTCHANYRFFDVTVPATKNTPEKRVQWFGGGSDLTPTYIVEDDARHFHSNLRSSLQPIDPKLYPEWKKACDNYFLIAHRGERRGVGGVFFDDEHTRSTKQYEQILRSLGEGFGAGYFPIVLKRMSQKFNEDELAFQQLRRGRYAEFNLVYDKGTTYGLRQPAARVDAILMSLPAVARFAYRRPNADKREEDTLQVLQKPKDW